MKIQTLIFQIRISVHFSKVNYLMNDVLENVKVLKYTLYIIYIHITENTSAKFTFM